MKKASTLRYFLYLGLFSIFTLAVLLLWKAYASPRFQTHLIWVIWLFFILTTTALHLFLTRITDPKKFIMYFMALSGLKMFFYLIIIFAYALLKKEAALGFTLFFLSMYFFYSGFEVVLLLKEQKKIVSN
ncbi:MAG: hypothetical protein ABI315_15920 [Bacteroidia bacterium]